MSDDYYLCDGVYWNYNEYDDPEKIRKLEEQHRKELAKYARKLKLIASRTKSSSVLRKKIFLIFLADGLKRMAFRYCKLEQLPQDYAVVALQENSLNNCIEHHLLKLCLDYKHNDVDHLVKEIYLNSERTNVYARVTKVQEFVHYLASVKYGNYGERKLDKHIMRKLLSICRLHIYVTELRKANLNSIRKEFLLNHSMSIACNVDFPEYLKVCGKKQIKNWKKRQLHSLLFYATQDERAFLRKLLNENENLSVNEIIKVMTNEWPLYEPILK